jgi:glutamine cyclotransferase
MNDKLTMNIFSFFFFLPFALSISCSGRPGNRSETIKPETIKAIEVAAPDIVRFITPSNNANATLNQQLEVELEIISANRTPDSVVIFFEGAHIATLKSQPFKSSVAGNIIAATGIKSLRALPYKDGKQQNQATRFVTVFADQAPKRYGYRVVRSYPHDINAFTQGLFFDSGLLYESTGQETTSWLREVELETGKPMRQHNLDRSLFGEGITLYDGRIFQITWRNKVGFVYDKATFRQINKIYYSTEGWGLTTVGDKIVLSDGTNILYFHNPETFAVVSKLEVYDNEKKVDNLNELEYIEGEIWANIWLTDEIARIDPVSGKVKDILT